MIGPFIDIISESLFVDDLINIFKSLSNDNEPNVPNEPIEPNETTTINNITVRSNNNRMINLLKQILTAINKQKQL